MVIPRTSEDTLVNLDPPYYGKGPELYTNFYRHADHAALAQAVGRIQRRWMVTYDNTPEIRQLYSRWRCFSSNLTYSAQVKRTGVELLVVDDDLHLPNNLIAHAVDTLVT